MPAATNAPAETSAPAAETAVMTAVPALSEASTPPVATAAPETTAAPTAAAATAVAPAATDTPKPTGVRLTLATATASPTAAPTAAATQEPQDPFFQEALAYNRSLLTNGVENLRSSKDLERFAVNAKKYGFKDNVIGTISIPRLEVEVPLYLGATDEHMAAGFAVMGMTSVPLGLEDENVAIAGHRGWRGAAMLRDVQMIMMGDPIYITTPWNTLTYIVTGIEIVTPTSINWCRIQKGKTMISLMTCHPYGQHTHRYIVHAELLREDNAEELLGAVLTPQETAAPTTQPTVQPTVQPTAPAATTVAATNMPSHTAQPEATAAADMTAAAPAETTPKATAAAVQESPAAMTAAPQPSGTAAQTQAAATALPPEATTATVTAAAPAVTTVQNEPPAEAATVTAASAAAPTYAARTAIPVVTQAPAAQQITLVHDDGTTEVVTIDTTAVNPDDSEYSTDWSNTLILAENSMRPVAYVTAGIVLLVGVWLVIVTIRDAKREKRGKQHDEQ